MVRRGVKELAMLISLCSENPRARTRSEDLAFRRKAAAGETDGGSTLGLVKNGSLGEVLAGAVILEASKAVGALKNLDPVQRTSVE